MPLVNLFFWLILLLCPFIIGALLAEHSRQERQIFCRLQKTGARSSAARTAPRFRRKSRSIPLQRRTAAPAWTFQDIQPVKAQSEDKNEIALDWLQALRPDIGKGSSEQGSDSRHSCA